MIKKIIVSVILIISTNISSYDFMKTNKSMYEFIYSFVVFNNQLYFHNEDIGEITLIDSDNIKLENTGYYIVSGKDKSNILIPGEKVSSFFGYDHYNKKDSIEKHKNDFPNYWFGFERTDINEISDSSFLVETIGDKKIEYKAEYLKNRFTGDCSCHPFNFNTKSTPWVEGVKGSGIGEKLVISFKEKSNFVVILNGYIDLYQRNLYKENGRLKEIKITSKDNDFVLFYSFSDYVHYATIELPVHVNNIIIELIDVYPGSKYNDTCISGILNTPKNVSDKISQKIINLSK